MAAGLARRRRAGLLLPVAGGGLDHHTDLGLGQRIGRFCAGAQGAKGPKPVGPTASLGSGRGEGRMKLPRRKFLKVGAGGMALLATAGCGQMPRELRQLLALVNPKGGPFQAPAAGEIDPIVHALNRAGFGARPGGYERVRKLAKTPEAAAAAWLEQQL